MKTVLFDLGPWFSITGTCLRNWALRDQQLREAVEIDVLLMETRCDVSAAVEAILARSPGLVGLSCYMWNVETMLAIAKAVKTSRPDVKLVLGGPEPAALPEKTLAENPGVDWVAWADEGEEVFRRLLRALALGDGPVGAVPGLACRDGDGRVRRNPPPPFIDLEAAPPLYAGGQRPPSLCGETGVLLEGSRGCPFTCKFCDWGDRKVRELSLARLGAEFEALAPRAGTISLTDADLLRNRRRGVEILEAFLAATSGSRCRLQFHTNPTFLNSDVIDVIARAPDKFKLSLGVQTLTEEALERTERALDLPRVERNLADLKARAPRAEAWIQIIFGLPGDDLEGFRRSLDWALRFYPQTLHLNALSVLPGSPLYSQAPSEGLVYSTKPPYRVRRTPTMSERALYRARELAIWTVHLSAHIPEILLQADASDALPNVQAVERLIEAFRRAGIALREDADLEEALPELFGRPLQAAAILQIVSNFTRPARGTSRSGPEARRSIAARA